MRHGGIIEVKDDNESRRVILVFEAKYQGKDIDNIKQGILDGHQENHMLLLQKTCSRFVQPFV